MEVEALFFAASNWTALRPRLGRQALGAALSKVPIPGDVWVLDKANGSYPVDPHHWWIHPGESAEKRASK